MFETISASTLYLFTDAISDPDVVKNPEVTERLFKVVDHYRHGMISEVYLCDYIEQTVRDIHAEDETGLQLFPVRFQMADDSVYKTVIPAYSNGGAENKVLDMLPGLVRRCLAFAPDGSGADIADELYPNAQWIDCMEVVSLAISSIECDED